MKRYIYTSLILAVISLTAISQVFLIQKNNGEIIHLPIEDVVEMTFKTDTNNYDDRTPEHVEIIDLGLSVNWASVNLGAMLPENPGYLISWGELEEKDWYSWSYYKFGHTKSTLTKYTVADGMRILQPEDDAATVLWGGDWRMPSREEWQELIDNCEIDYLAEENGYPGVRLTSKVPGYEDKSIFLVAAGWIQDEYHMQVGSLSAYWANECAVFPGEICLPEFAFAAEFWRNGDYGERYYYSGVYRWQGRPIRAVTPNEDFVKPEPDPLPTFAGNFDIYLNPSEAWSDENAWFALYLNNANTQTDIWVTLSDSNEDGIYKTTVPEGEWTGLTFFKMTNENTNATIDAALSKTSEMFYDGENNQCNILSVDELGLATVSWSVYTEQKPQPIEPEYVDLGLTVNWAAYNVGATTAEEYGYFVSWGELEEKDWYSWSYYKFGTSKNSLTKYCNSDGISTLESVDDIATQNYGANWRIPTQKEFQELVDYCDVDYAATENGVPGIRFTSKVPGYEDRSIFFPASGYMCDGSLNLEGTAASLWCNECVVGGFMSLPEYAFSVDITCNGSLTAANALRCYGKTVRGVTINEDYVEPVIPEPLPTFEGNFKAYLNIADQWSPENAWFALQMVNENDETSAWVTMTDNYGYGVYECTVPEGNWTGMIFTRQDAANADASIEVALAKTSAVAYDGTNNQYNLSAVAEDGTYSGSWGVYREPVATFDGGTTIYLAPTEWWAPDNAWFALYVFNANNNTNAWATFANPDANGVYNTTIPEGKWSGLIYVRLNPETTTPSWDFLWGQTADLVLDETNNQYTITGWGEDGKATGEWGIYTEPVVAPAEPEYVDLGLSINWATFNVGATAPEDYGYYVSWGETTEKDYYSWSYYAHGSKNSLSKYNKTDKKGVLEADDDAATANWGDDWRTPTKAEWQELFDNCTIEYTAQENGVNGLRFTSKISGYEDKSIFIPVGGQKKDSGIINQGAYGFYWTADCVTSIIRYNAFDAQLSVLGSAQTGSSERCYGSNVRAVRAKEATPEPLPTFEGNFKAYLNIADQWSPENAWFALQMVNENDETSAWVTMTDNYGYGVYECTVPEGNWTGMIFTRQDAANADASIEVALAKTSAVAYDGTNNQYNLSAVAEDGTYSGSWGVYREPVATFDGGTTIYLAPTEWWAPDNAWFALYVFNANNNTNAWATFANPDANGVYNTTIPEGKWSGLIYVRLNPETTTPSWDFLWGQTADLVLDETNNQYTITGWGEDGKATGEWGIYTEPVVAPAEPEYVDLGLSIYWATYNVGATAPEELGYYVSWGELEEKESYSWSTYKYGSDVYSLSKYCKADKIKLLEAVDDIATATYGDGWRTPTQDEWKELIDNCSIEYTATENGKTGVKLTSKVEGFTDKSIFIPYGGYKKDNGVANEAAYAECWTSECLTGMVTANKAYAVKFFAMGEASTASQEKTQGRNVRAVKAK